MEIPRKDEISRLMSEEARELAERLREEVRRHDYLYYVENRPEISDEEHDRLYAALVTLEGEYPDLVTEDSPTQRVGAEPLEEFPTVVHTAPMLSLDSTRESAEVGRFVERVSRASSRRVRFLLQPKLDGLSVELVYEDGSLERAATRGNGRQGEGVTENIRTIPTVPLRLRHDGRGLPSLLAVRGEVIMSVADFQELNRRLGEEGKEPFANPRNAAAGSLRQLDPAITADRPLALFAYEILTVEDLEFGSDSDALEALAAWGFRLVEGTQVGESLDDIEVYHRQWVERRDSLDVEIDGVVVKIDDLSLRGELGATSAHPRWALAYKFEPRQEVTRVEDIAMSVGRTGVVTPVALMRPVTLRGVTVARASLHNREEVARKDIRVGDRVRLQRAGDVIPEVLERVDEPEGERGPPFEMPKECPSCGSELVLEGPVTRCPNRFGCPAQLAGRIHHFASQNALDIDGLGDKTARLLVDRRLVTRLPDLFHLDPEDIEALEGFAERSARRLVDSIQESRDVELHRFLYALGIPGVGESVARDLAEHFRTLQAARSADRTDLRAVSGVGPEMAEEIRGFFEDERNQAIIDELADAGVAPREQMPPEEQPLDGLRFVFTGSLRSCTRAEAEELVESLGARATSSVSSETDYVVVGEDPGQKADDAAVLGIRTLDEDGFLEVVKDSGADV